MVAKLYPHDLGYSLRRYYVDGFYTSHVSQLQAESLVLDLGGHRLAKRGFFDIDTLKLNVIYTNLLLTRHPHVVADASGLPFRDHSYDAVICSELLEHVHSPSTVLAEVARVLKKGGVLLASVPFVFPVHPDPVDYFRYTGECLVMMLHDAGFTDIAVERQGGYWSVMIDMLRGLAQEGQVRGRWWWRPLRSVTGLMKARAVLWDQAGPPYMTPYLAGFTTGFGIIARK